ncbi:MAG: STAS domain-containing protein [Acidimicrobiales bacterium]
MEIAVERADGYTVCRPAGELDAFSVAEFRKALAALSNEGKLVIEMSEVPFVDSAGLGALIGGIRRAREMGSEVALSCNRPILLHLLSTTGFDRIVTVAETEQAAAQSLLAGAGPAGDGPGDGSRAG